MNTEVRPSPGLNLQHGFFRKIEQHQYNSQKQVKNEQVRKQETAKLAKKVGITNKSAKPTRQIYVPPSVRSSASTDDFAGLHMQNAHNIAYEQDLMMNGGVNRGPKVTFNLESGKELKSALKRSKSFGGSEALESNLGGLLHDREALSQEYEVLVRKALDNPNSLSSRQLMEVVRVLCSKAVENTQSAEPAAQMCFTIIQKENGETFLESLMNSCREWFNEKDKLLPRYMGGNTSGGHYRRWTAYVSFLMELYMKLKSQHYQLSCNTLENTGQTYILTTLLYESCMLILATAALNNVAEIECLRSVLITIGRYLESDSPERMQQLMALMRDAFLIPSVTAQVRKTLLELVELHASQWKLDLPQSMYYFPYTSMDRMGF